MVSECWIEEKKVEKMTQPSKEPCKKEACNIQACLSKNNFLPQRCVKVIQQLQYCCEQCEYKSTHCASVAGILKQINK
ncbi:cx9C motif-containing protein 4 isoform X2 [Salvia hispanica]|uniref:cx9C motif-containing protein 4 isoform X2 n=2 Tax=Salvia incertae sedis TaxID=2291027 RepID=UPI002009D7FF|nr:cx9C motif-containing protein 4 isoform X2 [Salvia hispanica]